jgi:ketosteroid isomerase-like protein
MHDSDEPMAPMFDAYREAILAKDVDAFMALFDENVRIFDMWERWSHEGARPWREMATEWFASLGTDEVAVEVHDARAIMSADLGVAHAFVTYRRTAADGKELRSMRNRLTWGLARKAGAWVVIHEHTSAPVEHATSKVVDH